MAKSASQFAKTQAIAASMLGVTRAALVDWSTHPDFPKRTKKGWNVDRIRKWAEKHGRGAFRRNGNGAGASGGPTEIDGITLTEANIRKTIEDAENSRIKKEMALAEQAKQIGQLVDADEVRRIYMQTVATLTAVHDSLADAVDRAMPDAHPSPDSWPEIRDRVMALVRKLPANVASAMQDLLSDDDETDE